MQRALQMLQYLRPRTLDGYDQTDLISLLRAGSGIELGTRWSLQEGIRKLNVAEMMKKVQGDVVGQGTVGGLCSSRN